MSGSEILILIISLVLCGFFLVQWFFPLFSVWPQSRVKFARRAFFLMPLSALIVFIITVTQLAAFDVVIDPAYQIFYIILGFAWIYLSLIMVSFFLGLSWKDDIFQLNNKAALPALFGAYLAAGLVYAGANIGDGPGWWCVVVAGGIGMIIFHIINILFHKLTGIIDKITVDRDLSAGIRAGCFFLSCGVILGRASGGDWVSFSQTVIDFWVAWPILPLLVIAVIAEQNFQKNKTTTVGSSILIGVIYLLIAIAVLFILPPFPENPLYSLIQEGFIK